MGKGFGPTLLTDSHIMWVDLDFEVKFSYPGTLVVRIFEVGYTYNSEDNNGVFKDKEIAFIDVNITESEGVPHMMPSFMITEEAHGSGNKPIKLRMSEWIDMIHFALKNLYEDPDDDDLED